MWRVGMTRKGTSTELSEGVRNFVFGHNMSKRCMYANQKETAPRVTQGSK